MYLMTFFLFALILLGGEKAEPKHSGVQKCGSSLFPRISNMVLLFSPIKRRERLARGRKIGIQRSFRFVLAMTRMTKTGIKVFHGL